MMNRSKTLASCALALVLSAGAAAQPATSKAPEPPFSAGYAAFQKGDFETAAKQWQAAQIEFDREKNAARQVDVRLNLAAAYQAIGDYRSAEMTLRSAAEIAGEMGDASREAAVQNALGSTLTFTQVYDQAEEALKAALAKAEQAQDLKAQALVRNNLGNLHAARQKFADALEAYVATYEVAIQLDDRQLMAKALTNAAVSALALDKENNALTGRESFNGATESNDRAIKAIGALPDSHEKAFLLLTAVQNDLDVIDIFDEERSRPLRTQRLLQAHATTLAALDVARKIEDKRSQSYAYGYLGHLYELDGTTRTDEALSLTRRAIFLAQQIQAPELLYRWEWQAGRLLKARAQSSEQIELAITAYQQAVNTLQGIRNDLTLGNGNRVSRQNFREGPGQLYFELADMLLKRADAGGDQQALQQYLVQARDAVELLKSAELLDYFQDPCVSLLEKKRQDIAAVGQGTAIVYLIPLRDRTEMLVSVSGGMKRFQAPVGAKQLTDEVNNFRRQLTSIRTERYFKHSVQLYNWLIAPIEEELRSSNIDTLVFVPDGVLRTIPMAALYDEKSEQFLIAKYATAVSPGLTLMEPKPIPRESVQILLNGLSEARLNFPALAYVPQELESISAAMGTQKDDRQDTLINADFTKLKVRGSLREQDYSIVHIASHGMFVSSSRDTFLLTYDGKLTLNELEQLLQPKQFKGRPVELLTLSACQTAVGDDRAALGLAGVAIKAGARSAVATLWCVNDEASADLITDFYQQLVNNPTISKAKAMQRAQMNLLKDERYTHPMYWSPFLIIGNWL